MLSNGEGRAVTDDDLVGPLGHRIYGPKPPRRPFRPPRWWRLIGGGPSTTPLSFIPPPDHHVLVITHVIELPFDIGVPNDKQMTYFDGRSDALGMWPPELQGALIGTDALAPGVSPMERLWFRRAWVRTALPSEAADHAFAVLTRRHQGRRGWWIRQASLRRFASRGRHQVQTLVAATYWADADGWPAGDIAAQRDFLMPFLERALTNINTLITGFALARKDGLLRPVALADLPPLCPVIIDAVDERLEPVGFSTSYPIHANIDTTHAEPIDADAFAEAFTGLTRTRQGDDLFALFHELLGRAVYAMRQHQWSDVAILLGTAIEVFLSGMTRAAGSALGEPPARTNGALESGLKNLLQHHLARYAPMPVDLTDQSNPVGRWFLRGYKLRNDVVHNGHAATRVEVESAFDSAIQLVQETRRALESRPQTAHVAGQLFIA